MLSYWSSIVGLLDKYYKIDAQMTYERQQAPVAESWRRITHPLRLFESGRFCGYLGDYNKRQS